MKLLRDWWSQWIQMIVGVAILMKHQTLMEDYTALDEPHKCV